MVVAVVREIMLGERRVALTPAGAGQLVADGHRVLVEQGAGNGASFTDAEYLAAGAEVLRSAGEAWAGADLLLKVKEPLPDEYHYLRPGLQVFTYLHLAGSESLTRQMVASGVTGLAYETIQLPDRSLPLLEPMSVVAGRLALQVGMHYLLHEQGRGVMLAGPPGVPQGQVVVLGAGKVGTNAAMLAARLGARVTVLDVQAEPLRRLDELLDGRVSTVFSTPAAVAEATATADLVIGAVLVAGGRAPIVLQETMVRAMQPGAVICDVAIDQGGCVATTRATTHLHPIYVLHGVVHYAVPNMPALAPRTSTLALTNATLPYVRQIAGRGLAAAIAARPELAGGVNCHAGALTCGPVGEAFGIEVAPLAL